MNDMSEKKALYVTGSHAGGKKIAAIQELVDSCNKNNITKIEVISAGDSEKAKECHKVLRMLQIALKRKDIGFDVLDDTVKKYKDK